MADQPAPNPRTAALLKELRSGNLLWRHGEEGLREKIVSLLENHFLNNIVADVEKSCQYMGRAACLLTEEEEIRIRVLLNSPGTRDKVPHVVKAGSVPVDEENDIQHKRREDEKLVYRMRNILDGTDPPVKTGEDSAPLQGAVVICSCLHFEELDVICQDYWKRLDAGQELSRRIEMGSGFHNKQFLLVGNSGPDSYTVAPPHIDHACQKRVTKYVNRLVEGQVEGPAAFTKIFMVFTKHGLYNKRSLIALLAKLHKVAKGRWKEGHSGLDAFIRLLDPTLVEKFGTKIFVVGDDSCFFLDGKHPHFVVTLFPLWAQRGQPWCAISTECSLPNNTDFAYAIRMCPVAGKGDGDNLGDPRIEARVKFFKGKYLSEVPNGYTAAFVDEILKGAKALSKGHASEYCSGRSVIFDPKLAEHRAAAHALKKVQEKQKDEETTKADKDAKSKQRRADYDAVAFAESQLGQPRSTRAGRVIGGAFDGPTPAKKARSGP